jgi:hypothetical protein
MSVYYSIRTSKMTKSLATEKGERRRRKEKHREPTISKSANFLEDVLEPSKEDIEKEEKIATNPISKMESLAEETLSCKNSNRLSNFKLSLSLMLGLNKLEHLSLLGAP